MEQLNEDFFEDEEFDIDYAELETIDDISTSDNKSAKAFRFHVGMRNVKTALAATLCALLYFPFHRNPTFACIGAIFGMGSDMQNSRLNGGNRLFGTIFGGLIGIFLYFIYIYFYPEGGIQPLLFVLLFIGVIFLVLVCQLFVWPGAIQPAGVVLCIILFNTPVDSYIQYSLNRIFDTAIGVVIALIVNMVISRERVTRYKKYFAKKMAKKQ